MAADRWNPAQYDKFKAERQQPFFDLLGLIEARDGMRVADLGCGTGELTGVLHERLGAAATVGLDSSAAMLAGAAALPGRGLTFVQEGIETFAAAAGPAYDLIFANASLQWCDDHPALLARLARRLAAGGQLAVQMPMNHDYPTHTLAAALAPEPRRSPLLTAERYAGLLFGLGFKRQRVRLEVYGHVLAARDDVIEWVKGTLLTYYQSRMDEAAFAAFMVEYRRRLFAALPDARPFFYPFKRILIWGGM